MAQRKEEERRREKGREAKRNMRLREISKDAEGAKKRKEEKKKEEDAERAKEERRKREKEAKMAQKRKEEQDLQKEKLKNYRTNQEKERLFIEKEAEAIAKETMAKKKKELKEFLAKKQQEQVALFEKKQKERENSKETERQKAEKAKEREEKNKKRLESALAEARKSREKEKEANWQLHAMSKKANYQKVFGKYGRELEYLFKFYSSLYPETSVLQNSKDFMPFRACMQFGFQFQIYPLVVRKEEFKLAYRSVSKDLKIDGKTPVGIDQETFRELLLRISAKNQKFCKNFSEEEPTKEKERKPEPNEKGQGGNEQKEPKSKGRDLGESRDSFSIHKASIDEYKDIEEMTPFTLEGLLIFMEMDKGKKELMEKLNKFRIENRSASKETQSQKKA